MPDNIYCNLERNHIVFCDIKVSAITLKKLIETEDIWLSKLETKEDTTHTNNEIHIKKIIFCLKNNRISSFREILNILDPM